MFASTSSRATMASTYKPSADAPATVEIALPSQARVTASTRAHPQDFELEQASDPIDDFFGARSSRPLSLPPPYSEPPAYSVEEAHEPVTLALYLFKYGFLFPPFWVLGACVLCTRLRAPEDWHPEKTDVERQQLLEDVRSAERKWALRCVWALLGLLLFVGLVVMVAVVVMKSRA